MAGFHEGIEEAGQECGHLLATHGGRRVEAPIDGAHGDGGAGEQINAGLVRVAVVVGKGVAATGQVRSCDVAVGPRHHGCHRPTGDVGARREGAFAVAHHDPGGSDAVDAVVVHRSSGVVEVIAAGGW